MSHLVLFQWDGEAMQPQPRFRKACDERFTVGEVYRMEVSEPRSRRSHNFYFAAVDDAWANLPEGLAPRFPSPDHLRKWALVHTGFCTCVELAFDSEKSAQIGASAFRDADPYAVMVIKKATLQVFRPKSQKLKSMGKDEFQKSKEAVLGKLSEILGTTVGELQAQAKANA